MTWACFWCCVKQRDDRARAGSAMTPDAGRAMKERIYSAEGQDLRLFIVAGEHSGDALGAKLMAALNERRRGRVRYVGVGGAQMAEQGLVSQFPIEDVAVMGAGRDPGAAAHAHDAASTARSPQPSPPSPMRSSSSTAPSSRTRSPGACAGAGPRSPSSTTCRRACGPGGPAGRARCAATSITCWRCCRSSRTRIRASAGRPAPTSAIR